MLLDELEFIRIENQTTDFPKHFHETFCISLIHSGMEQIDLDHQRLFSEKGSISITNPYEIHSNPLMDKNAHLGFDTLYLSNDLMKYVLHGKNISFFNRKIENERANRLFVELQGAMDTKNAKTIESALDEFVQTLKYHSRAQDREHPRHELKGFDQICTYIEDNICHKFSLDELSRMANINKYGFVKKFKASTGMTPMNYILMKKIFSSKKLIDQNSELTEIAFQYDFADMAHFSKTFKRYVGVSPKKYQSGLGQLP